MEDETSVRVALRVRPQSAAERIDMCRVCTYVTPGDPQVILGKDKAFTFDHVFDIESKQFAIYEQCLRGLVEGCLDGYNATVLAYGQTGSGKTYTMGTGFDISVSPEEEGIIPRAVAHLFEGIDRRRHDAKQRNEPLPDFKVTVQFMELYNEELMDLFEMDNNKGRRSNVKIHEDANGNIYTMGVTLKPVNCAQDTLNCLQQGALSRTTASTNMNAQSSRSHAIFAIHIKQQRVIKVCDDDSKPSSDISNYEYEMLSAKFNFVDLAGSERLKRTGATGDRAKEGISINCGLLALGNVISALGDLTKKGSHVPYRDSKLTRLLQDSLGGNSRTLMIACVSPSDRDFMETLNTLKYANRARNIKNKVVLNQDKTSKQISSLRLEIQKLTVELMEFKQGKRLSGVEGDQVSDVSHENVMLKSENDKLRVRIKALQTTIDTQSVRITDLISSQVLATMEGGEVDGGVEELIQKYLKEIEELRNKLTESEAMAMAITRHASLKSRMTSPSSQESATSVLELAKMDVAKQRQKAQKLSREEEVKDQPWGEHSSDESSSEDEDEENEEDQNEGTEVQGDDDDDDDDDDSDDDEPGQNNNEHDISGDLADLSTEITIKEKLIDELETSQKKIISLKTQYEEKLSLLHHKIKDTEVERDQVLQSVKEQDSKSQEKAKHIRDEYEKKINRLQGELKKMQAAKKEHARLLRQKAQNEQQLRIFTGELSELKRTKVRLMKQMKEEVSKNKQKEAQRNKEIAQLKKESRTRQMTIKNLEMEKRQREIVLKRKQEEVKSLRRQQKPVSGQLGTHQRNQTTTTFLEVNGLETTTQVSCVSSSHHVTVSSTSTHSSGAGGRPSGLPIKSPRKKSSMEQAARSAKKKWDVIDKKVSSLIIKKQTIANMESDMDRWIQDRDRLSKQMEKCQMKYDSAAQSQKDETNVQEMKEQLEALTAHVDYVQENITECQTSIVEIEEQGGDTSEIGEFFATCTLAEARILLEHFLTKVISLGHEASSKEASAKEVEARLNAMKQHNELQQELLQHVLQYHDAFSSVENLAVAASTGTDSDFSGSELRNRLKGSVTSLDSLKDETGTLSRSSSGSTGTVKDFVDGPPEQPAKPKDKARRRTGTQEEFLYPDRIKSRRDLRLEPVGDEDEAPSTSVPALSMVPALPCPGDPRGGRQISPELMQKLLELEKTRKAQNSESVMAPPPPATQGSQTQGQGVPVKTSRSSSLNGNSTVQLPASLVRGNVKSKSARSFPVSKYGGLQAGIITQPRSQPTSPALQRKALTGVPGTGVDDSVVTQKTQEDVFARLTSSLALESDPDVGRMLPLRPPAGKPASLVCTYAATGHNSAVLSLDVTEDLMFTGSKDRTVKVWDLNTGEETLSCAGHKRDVLAVRFCPQTQRIFGASQNVIKVWDVRDGKCIKSLSPPGSSLGTFLSSMTSETQINDLKLSANGSLLYTAMGTTVRIWDLNSYSMTGKLGGHAGPVMTLLVHETNKDAIVFTGSRDHYVKIFEVNGSNVGVQTAKYKLEPPHYDGVQSLALKGKYLFSGSRDNSIKKWNVANQQLVQHMTGAHKDWVCALDFLHPQNVLLSGCRGGLLKLWQAETGAQVCEIKAHRHPINAICTNSSCVFTASSDRLVRLWRVTGTLDDQLHELNRSVQV